MRSKALQAIGSSWLRAALAAAMLTGMAAAGGTPVERGDLLFVSVVGVPEIVREARVDIDGRITLPLIGAVDVAGADLATITDRLANALVEQQILIQPSVLVEVAAYRPIWVGGAVRESGPLAYEPGLTARHALIAAGGRAAPEATIGLGEVLELNARRRGTIDALADADAEITRLSTRLDAEQSAALPEVDAELLREQRDQREADLAHAQTAVTLVETELEVLRGQAALQLTEQEAQREEIARTETLVERGLVPAPKLAELRREVSRLSRDILDNHAFTARAEQARADIRHRTAATLAERRITTRHALRDALLRRKSLQSELAIIEGHLLAAGQAGASSLTEDGEEDGGGIVIYRVEEAQTHQLDASPDTVLEPGDIVEFAPVRIAGG